MNINIVFEDKNILVAEKPQGVPSQKDKTEAPDLNSYLMEYLNLKNPKDLNIINRLDRPVGGLVLFGKTSEATKALARDVQARSIKKDYIAVVEGRLETEVAELKDYITKNSKSNLSKITDQSDPSAKQAILSYKLLATKGNLSLLNIRLKTGRHHQIRVQLAHHGLPIWGDTKYNPGFSNVDSWTNIALWSYKLSLRHPVKKKIITLYSLPLLEYPWTEFRDELESLTAK